MSNRRLVKIICIAAITTMATISVMNASMDTAAADRPPDYLTSTGIFYYPGTSYRNEPCELCGKAIAIQVYSNNNWSFADTAVSNLPISSLEACSTVDAWSFNLSHDLCDECALLANEKVKKPLVAKHKELWESLVSLKAEEKAECEKRRKGLHQKELKDKIFELTERLMELEGKQEPNEPNEWMPSIVDDGVCLRGDPNEHDCESCHLDYQILEKETE